MVDIQSLTAENWRGKKEDTMKEPFVVIVTKPQSDTKLNKVYLRKAVSVSKLYVFAEIHFIITVQTRIFVDVEAVMLNICKSWSRIRL